MKRAIALGVFDGLHKAHTAVLAACCDMGTAAGMTPAALLFPVHPMTLLNGEAPPQLLADEARNEMLQGMGLELLFMPFEEIHNLPPEEFFAEILVRRLNAGAVCCGYHYHFGKKAQGDAALLRRLCEQYGLQYRIVPKMEYQGQAISATRIRAALEEGRLADANVMLGRPFGYIMKVVEGAKIGRTLGAPTLNQVFRPGFCVPKYGVYGSEAFVEGRWQASITNIGLRPSVDKKLKLHSETHVLGYEGDLYGQNIPVRLLRFLREERKFQSIEELKQQIRTDIDAMKGRKDSQ